jgi:drug/metabolite transporter (DMT)-like permease
VTARTNTLSPLIVACLAATWFIWGSTYLGIKFALRSFPPFFQMGTRFVVAGVLLLVWALWRGHQMPTPVQWRNALIAGTLMLGGSMGGAAYAEQTVASGLVVAFAAITPALITIASLPFGIRPSRLEVLGIAIGMSGVFILISGAGFSSSPGGLIAMIIATVGWSTGSVLSQNVFRLAPASAGFASQMICGGVFLLSLSLFSHETFHWPPLPLAAASWVYLVVFGSILAFSAYMMLLSSTSTTLASSYCFVNPVIGMLLGIWLGGESATAHEWIAVGIIVIGVTVVVVGRGVYSRPVTTVASQEN